MSAFLNQRVPKEDRLLQIPEAAVCLTIEEKTLRDWILKRRIGVVRIGAAVRNPESEIARILVAGWTPPVEIVGTDAEIAVRIAEQPPIRI